MPTHVDDFQKAFDELDEDQDGFVVCSDLQRLLQAMDQDVDDVQVEAVFKDADLSGRGKISFPEFLKIMTD